ncbi:MAG: tetratricopeptide repeat protein [Pacificimonas sp.]
MILLKPVLAGLLAIGAATTASGAITVVGNSDGALCYESAKRAQTSATALATCTKALEEGALSKRDKTATFVNRGIVHVHRGDVALGLADYETALAMDANLAEAHTNRGIALWRTNGSLTDALAALDRGIALGTAEPEVAHFMRAVVHEDLGNLENAYLDYKRALEIAPGWELAQVELSRFVVPS